MRRNVGNKFHFIYFLFLFNWLDSKQDNRKDVFMWKEPATVNANGLMAEILTTMAAITALELVTRMSQMDESLPFHVCMLQTLSISPF